MNRRAPILGNKASLPLAFYSAALGTIALLGFPWWARGLRQNGKYREGAGERLGRVPRERFLRVPGRPVVWIHAVSVGEVLAAAPLIVRLRAALPDGQILVSTTTRTGQAVARARFGAASVFYFPLDFRFAVRAWLRSLQPSLLVLLESELWPRMLAECSWAGVPVALVNARISGRSWPRYLRLRGLWRPLFRTLALVHAQTEEDAERFRTLGAPRVEVGGNLKYDVEPAPETPLVCVLAAALPTEVPLQVCGSTLAGEEALLLRELPPEPVLLLAPRHPERFGEVAALLAAGTRPWMRLSSWRLHPQPIAPGAVLLLDSVGELAALYRLATVALVGGGFLHGGGHNPLEPASLGKPVVVGPGYANFVGIVETLRRENALIVAGRETLHTQVSRLLADPEQAQAAGARARSVCERNAGATARALQALLALVQT